MQLYNTNNFQLTLNNALNRKKNYIEVRREKKFHGLDIIIKCCVEWKRNDNDDDG
jgi:hypothetical protein